ncbi:MAG: KH domain-containing protein, partial [Methanococcaceae archaeon]
SNFGPDAYASTFYGAGGTAKTQQDLIQDLDFREREARKDFIQVAIIVEKESQKPILIGKKGAAIKKLGETSRAAIESFLQRPVFLDMRVKVKNKWRSDPNSLKSFGYSFDADEEE